MPNYVQNRVQFDMNIPDQDFRAFLLAVTERVKPETPELPAGQGTNPAAALTVQDFSDRHFDFNKLIPMPESLNIASGTMTDMGITLHRALLRLPLTCCEYVLAHTNWYGLFHARNMDGIETEYKAFAKLMHPDTAKDVPQDMAHAAMQHLNSLYKDAKQANDVSKYVSPETAICDMAIERVRTAYEGERLRKAIRASGLDPASLDALTAYTKTEEGSKEYELGKTACDNLEKYGATTWYDWACKNWGTKWNAMDTRIDVKDRVMTFQTAWSSPEPIVRKCAEMFPDITFTWQYADEDTGSNTGRYIYKNGSLDVKYFDSCCQEAYQTYVDCWGGERSQCLYQDENGKWLTHTCENCPHPC